MNSAPESPVYAAPVLNTILPLDPVTPFEVVSSRFPLLELVLGPVVMLTVPPEEIEDVPA
jgi:hypothetical protein